MIQKKMLRVKFVGISKEEYKKPYFEMDLFSYVGTMIKVDALRMAGTTNQELFIYGDDNEHSFRLKKYGKLICVPESRFIHDTPGVETREVGWHNYYNRRNQLYIIKKYFPKRYLVTRLCKRYLLDISPLSRYTKDERRLFLTAQQDALAERLGKHAVYKPGFHF
jgi:GT2 family glycosyltransferase